MFPITWPSAYVIKKLKLYEECCDQLLLSDEPNSAYKAILYKGGPKSAGIVIATLEISRFTSDTLS